MATNSTKWKGWVTLHRGQHATGFPSGPPLTGSKEYFFELPGTDQNLTMAAERLMELWEEDGRRVGLVEGYDPAETGLTSYPSIEALDD